MRNFKQKSVCNGYIVSQTHPLFPTFNFKFVMMWDSINFLNK